jgi:hypothetical protein
MKGIFKFAVATAFGLLVGGDAVQVLQPYPSRLRSWLRRSRSEIKRAMMRTSSSLR